MATNDQIRAQQAKGMEMALSGPLYIIFRDRYARYTSNKDKQTNVSNAL